MWCGCTVTCHLLLVPRYFKKTHGNSFKISLRMKSYKNAPSKFAKLLGAAFLNLVLRTELST